jgi:hypothetical protein
LTSRTGEPAWAASNSSPSRAGASFSGTVFMPLVCPEPKAVSSLASCGLATSLIPSLL